MKSLRTLFWPVLSGLLIALLLIQQYPQWVGLPPRSRVSLPTILETPVEAYSYAPAVKRAALAVVNLYTSQHAPDTATTLRHYHDGRGSRQPSEAGLGSAVIMRQDGYLLTNNHVVSHADEIIVTLRDGRETHARVIGNDPETDLAVLKIDLPRLPVIHTGRSDDVQVGDVALAIGNPLAVGQTVTMGIISATGRNQLGLNTYEDFIQTDAAINRGNSGGALVDAAGNLIGINAAIISETGGYQGIGFAIPVKLALNVMQSIIEHGHVIRGWLGVEVQQLTPELIESFNLKRQKGIIVAAVYPDGPADRAGLEAGDVLLSIDDVKATDGWTSMNQVAQARPGTRIAIAVLRKGRRLTLSAEVGTRPPEQAGTSES